jgi:G3E family GTPase
MIPRKLAATNLKTSAFGEPFKTGEYSMPQNFDIPVTILGGYLGSGKTTLVNHLLRNADGKRLAILVNEFGELPIDADLIEAQDDDITSLSGGCVCCSFGSDLTGALVNISKMEPAPDHVVLEASGVALPGAILGALSLMRGFTMDGVVVLADAETVQARSRDKYMSDTILRQLIDADLLILNKVDLISSEAIAKLRTWANTTAPNATIVEAQHAKLPLEIILQDFAPVTPTAQIPHHLGGFKSVWKEYPDPIDPQILAAKIIAETPHLVRAKGFVIGLDGTVQTIQIAGKRAQISSAPESKTRGLVIITHGALA